MTNALERIKAYKLEEIAARKAAKPLGEIETDAWAAPPVRGFADALRAAEADGRYGLIAEVKKASPSKGLIREDFRPRAIAHAYESGGASCLSVLTDGPSFQGHEEYLVQAREAVDLPVLRKDFMYDPWQVAEARALGADCILIIMASVSDAQARELEAAAKAHRMDALIEVHDGVELERALELESPLIGINNRDLRTFETRLETTEELAGRVPRERIVIAESGIFLHSDLMRLEQAGARSFLVGESLMRQDDIEAATRTLLTGAAA
ncbi:MAG: indole-3-glycerol phosphate synthase TrpC [Pseudomonadota bacterium]